MLKFALGPADLPSGPLVKGLKAVFMKAYDKVIDDSLISKVCTVVKSDSASEDYSWIGEVPGMREFISERQIKDLANFNQNIVNKVWENTIGVKRTDVENQKLGMITTRIQRLAIKAARHKEQLVMEFLTAALGSAASPYLCYDGQGLFDGDHPTPDGGWVATHEDITPFVLLRNERDRGLSLIAAIVENIPMIIFVKDATDFRYLLFNRAGAVAHRISHDQVIGTDANGLFSKDAADAILQQERDFMASGDRVSTAEQKMTTRHGDEKLFHVTRVKLKGNGDKIEYILGIVQDFTARLEMLKEQAPPRTARLEKVGH